MDTNNFIGDGSSLESEVGTYFIYNKRNWNGSWAGYQIALKVSYQYCVPVGLSYEKLCDAVTYADMLTAAAATK
jgi:hypothetical protein